MHYVIPGPTEEFVLETDRLLKRRPNVLLASQRWNRSLGIFPKSHNACFKELLLLLQEYCNKLRIRGRER